MIIPLSLILANLAIDMVVPAGQIDSRAGLMQSFDVFFRAFHITFMDNVIALCLFIGAFAGAAMWSLGLSRYLKRIAENGFMPKSLAVENKSGIPQNALLFQAVVFTFICLIYLFMPSIKSAYWVLSDLTAQLALIAYVIFFIAAIRLRLKYKWIKKVEYTVGPVWVSVTIYVIGAIACALGIVAGFILPADSGMTLISFDSILIGGILFFLVIPAIIMIVKAYRGKGVSKQL